ncbi:MAG: hypothetical protein KVP17_002508 [Porospora cf. gigantea B]|uniref:uncharacterized protein n=3 Tax=Porospora cf. gigantea B TaxID=2853592 RepID=UPI003571D452|nr:MAG: hypothetical protein KVP17_002508 [Porospora cf. gigantea B]
MSVVEEYAGNSGTSSEEGVSFGEPSTPQFDFVLRVVASDLLLDWTNRPKGVDRVCITLRTLIFDAEHVEICYDEAESYGLKWRASLALIDTLKELQPTNHFTPLTSFPTVDSLLNASQLSVMVMQGVLPFLCEAFGLPAVPLTQPFYQGLLPTQAAEAGVIVSMDVYHDEPPADLVTSRFVRDYKVVRVLGSGGFGSVSLCVKGAEVDSRDPDKLFAVKTIRLPSSNKAAWSLVLREAKIAATLAHGLIVRYYSAWVECMAFSVPARLSTTLSRMLQTSHSSPTPDEDCGMTLYLAMEYVRGSTLYDVIETREVFKQPAVIWHFFEMIVTALDFLHKRSFIHRDLKPENVFVLWKADASAKEVDLLDCQLKIGDFGLSTVLGDRDSLDCHVKGKFHLSGGMGTRFYAAPEQEKGGWYGPNADVYSFGVLFFELWHEPFKTSMERSCVLIDLLERGLFPESFSKRVPSYVVDLIRCMVSRDANSRPTASDLLTFPWNSQVRAPGSFPKIGEMLSQPELTVHKKRVLERVLSMETSACAPQTTPPSGNLDFVLSLFEEVNAMYVQTTLKYLGCDQTTRLMSQQGAVVRPAPSLFSALRDDAAGMSMPTEGYLYTQGFVAEHLHLACSLRYVDCGAEAAYAAANIVRLACRSSSATLYLAGPSCELTKLLVRDLQPIEMAGSTSDDFEGVFFWLAGRSARMPSCVNLNTLQTNSDVFVVGGLLQSEVAIEAGFEMRCTAHPEPERTVVSVLHDKDAERTAHALCLHLSRRGLLNERRFISKKKRGGIAGRH